MSQCEDFEFVTKLGLGGWLGSDDSGGIDM